jgi:transposase
MRCIALWIVGALTGAVRAATSLNRAEGAIVATVGDLGRFASPEKLVSYFGLNLEVRQSGGLPAVHGHISKQGRAHARGMLVEAAWVAAKPPGTAAGLL